MTSSSKEYQKIVTSLKRRAKGATVADVCSATALPLSVVRDILPKAADEYSGHLRVTQSGEILYYFPHGFTSRYKGLGAFCKRITGKLISVTKKVLTFLFKIWIMVMLIGYFVLFIALALASIFISMAARSSDRDSGGGSGRGGFMGFGLFDIMIRLWFYSELTRPRHGHGHPFYGNNQSRRDTKPKRPMHKAIFSFVFGEEDPNKNWEEQKNKSIINFIQSNKGVISIVEYMAFTGENSLEAEKSILSFCSKFGGSPEVTEEGTIVYRFDELLLRSETKKFKEIISPIQRLKTFSVNTKKMNGWFAVINAVNLIFGSYFLYQSINAGQLITEIQYQTASYLYGFTHALMDMVIVNPHLFIMAVLGLVPFLFSFLFWLIPAARYYRERKENDNIKLTNFKRFGFNKIWSSPKKIDINSMQPSVDECRPKNISVAADTVIKDIGVISIPEIETDENGKTLYSFNGLESEKQALEKYRAEVDVSALQLGKTVFDSQE